MKQPFVLIYDGCFNDVYRYVYSKVGNKWDTDDIVSEIFRKAFEKYESLQDHSNARAWLFTIARHTVIDFYRRRKDVPTGEEMERVASQESFAAEVEQEEELDCLQKVLAFLPEEDRELVKLKYFAGLKHREIGDVLSKSEEVIKMRAFRLLKKMSILVKNCLEGVKANG
ncbi:RNA polymerase sigma factor [Paenibacillus sp. 32352]|uniref:RNA polymerase sigma factor n=1 Tax=Paenibacillus sp. 32352 TaxID=1969111 RepID=UPI0009AEED09|nr:RNA polymerase sigma factor [Paenibacillus sp. 32352]